MNATLSDSTRSYPGSYPGQDYNPQSFDSGPSTGPLRIRRPGLSDIGAALMAGARDWLACRTDVLVLVVLFPLAALCLAGVIIEPHLLPFLFPICAGVAIIGPAGTLWFAALSRQRERDGVATADAAAAIFDSPRLGTIKGLGWLLVGLFAVWIAVAGLIYAKTLGSAPFEGGFFSGVFTTPAGHQMIIFGVLAGAVFALIALGIGLIGFPLALDREMSLGAVVATSFRAALSNPVFALGWGVTIVLGLIIGAIPGLLGLAVTIPVLGHASWHIYRMLIDDHS